MARSQRDRSRAFRIRHSESPSDSDREWLNQYEHGNEPSGAKAQPPIPQPQPLGGGELQSELLIEDVTLDTDEIDGSGAFEYDIDNDVDNGDSPGAPIVHALGNPVPTCGKPSCPACSKTVGGSVCSATGQVVWDPVDIDACRGMGKGMLALLGVAASFVRTDKRVIQANEREITSMANALQKATYRRFNALGAIDDILLGVATVGAFGMRALTEPAIAPKSE